MKTVLVLLAVMLILQSNIRAEKNALFSLPGSFNAPAVMAPAPTKAGHIPYHGQPEAAVVKTLQLQPSPTYQKIAELFEQGKPATAQDLTGWYIGYEVAPDSLVGDNYCAILIGQSEDSREKGISTAEKLSTFLSGGLGLAKPNSAKMYHALGSCEPVELANLGAGAIKHKKFLPAQVNTHGDMTGNAETVQDGVKFVYNYEYRMDQIGGKGKGYIIEKMSRHAGGETIVYYGFYPNDVTALSVTAVAPEDQARVLSMPVTKQAPGTKI